MAEPDQIDQIKAAIDLRDLISETCKLDSSGRGSHENKHDSKSGDCLYVSHDLWYCHHCHAGGDVFNWIMDRDEVNFPEALRTAAGIAGVNLAGVDHKAESERRQVFGVLKAAAIHFHENLSDARRADITTRWGITDETIDNLLIGISRKDDALEVYLKQQRFTHEQLMESGLFYTRGVGITPYYQGRIVFPYWKSGTVQYLIARTTGSTPLFRGKEDKRKYLKLATRKGGRTHISEHVKNILYGVDSLMGASDWCLITEGVTDCVMAIQAGISCISPVTTEFKEKDYNQMLKLVKRFDMAYICNDNEENEAGLGGAIGTAEFLEANGITTRLVTLPRPEGVEKIDLAEYLRDHTVEEFRALCDTAAPVWNVKLSRQPVSGDAVENIKTAEKFIAEELSGMNAAQRVAFIESDVGGHFGMSDAAAAKLVMITSIPVGDESIPYGIEDGCFVKYEQVKDKHGEWSTKTNVLCNFTIDLTKDVYADDGIEPRRIYTGDVVVNGSRFPFEEMAKKFVISSDFGRVLASAAGSVARFENRTLQDIRLAMQMLSKPICKSVVATFGLADDHTYVTPTMIIDRDGIRRVEDSNVDLSDSGNASNLDLDIISDEEFRTAGENIINHLLNIHNRYFVDCLIGHTFISPITSAILKSDQWSGERIGMFAVGMTGSGKSFTATRFQRFFGVFNSDKTITGWSSTPYSIQRTGYFFKDAIFLVDDFKVGYFKGNRSKYAAMIEVLQNYPDGQGRERLTADIQARKGYHIRGNVLITGEDLPPEASIVGRYHIVNVNERDKNRGEWRACFECQHLYRGFMARFILWIIRQDGYADRVVDQINTLKLEIIADRTTANIDRLAQSLMYNLAGFELFCDFTCESGFIDAYRRATMIETHRNNLIGEIESMATFIHSQTAAELYLTTLRDLVSSGALKIHSCENTRYCGNGYMEEEIPIEETWNCGGFDKSQDDLYIYVFPQVAYRAVVETLNRMDEPFSHSQNETGKELIEGGHMKEGRSGNISQVWYQNKNRKVWALYKKSIDYETDYLTQSHL